MDSDKKKDNIMLHCVIGDRYIYLSTHTLLLLAVVRPTLECGSEVWEAKKRLLHWHMYCWKELNVFLVVHQGL